MKQVIAVRRDIKLQKGKMAAQVAHASVEAILRSKPEIVRKWRSQGMKKVVVYVDTLEDLIKLKNKADSLSIVNALITDAGLTQIPPNTVTCLGLGPDDDDLIDKITRDLKLV